MSYIDIVFDGPPGNESGRFIEIENSTGASITLGTWLQRGDYFVLRITPEAFERAIRGAQAIPATGTRPKLESVRSNAVSSAPVARDSVPEPFTMAEGTFGGELDEYSPGAQDESYKQRPGQVDPPVKYRRTELSMSAEQELAIRQDERRRFGEALKEIIQKTDLSGKLDKVRW